MSSVLRMVNTKQVQEHQFGSWRYTLPINVPESTTTMAIHCSSLARRQINNQELVPGSFLQLLLPPPHKLYLYKVTCLSVFCLSLWPSLYPILKVFHEIKMKWYILIPSDNAPMPTGVFMQLLSILCLHLHNSPEQQTKTFGQNWSQNFH